MMENYYACRPLKTTIIIRFQMRFTLKAVFICTCSLMIATSIVAQKLVREPVKKLSPEDEAIFTEVQKQTFQYFWDGAEPNSGMARERIHVDSVYPDNDQNIVTTGGSGFG